MRSLLLIFLAAFALTAESAHAAPPPQINVGVLFDYLQPARSSFLKRIRNTGASTAYVRVEVAEMNFNEEDKATETPVDTLSLVRNTSGARGVIASPSRMIIAANGQQATRLIYRGSRDVERYYRLRFIPVAPTSEEFSISEEQAQKAVELSSSVRLFTGFGTILFVAPENVRYQTREDSGRVYNDGNATVVLDDLRYCKRDKPDTCTAGIIVHVRPGRSYDLQVAATDFVRYDLMEGESKKEVDSRH